MTKDEIRAEIERLEREYREIEHSELEKYKAAREAFNDRDGTFLDGLIAAWPHMPETVALQAERDAFAARVKELDAILYSDTPTYLPNVWYDWHGGECPVDGKTEVEVKFLNDNEPHGPYPAADWIAGDCWWKWESRHESNHITSFKITTHP